MQVDSFSKIIFVHIPRTGGSWFGYSWRSNYDGRGDYNLRQGNLVNSKNKKQTPIGRHGTIKGIKQKFQTIDADITGYKFITLVREPIDRVLSAWSWFSEVNQTAKRQKWKTIDHMLDAHEKGIGKTEMYPQTYWLKEDDAKFDHIFRFEDLLKGHDVIRKYFPDFPKRGKPVRFRNNTRKSWLKRQGRHDGYKKYLDKKQIDRIKELYKEDIDYLAEYYD